MLQDNYKFGQLRILYCQSISLPADNNEDFLKLPPGQPEASLIFKPYAI
jgi:hypothetical protein